jgi:hypothetical protein
LTFYQRLRNSDLWREIKIFIVFVNFTIDEFPDK